MTITNPYGDFDDKTGNVITGVKDEGLNVIHNNLQAGMFITGAFVLWRVAKRVVRSVG